MRLIKTEEQCSCFDKLQQKLDHLITDQNQRIIIGRDFNVVRDPNLDSSGGSPKEKRSAKISDICLNYDLTDIWRIRNPDNKIFT